MCEQVLIIAKGRLGAFDKPENLEQLLTGSAGVSFQVEASQDAAQEILSRAESISHYDIACDSGVCSVTAALSQNAAAKAVCGQLTLAFAAKGLPVFEMKTQQASLEDVFLELTESDRKEEPSDDCSAEA